MKSSLIALSVIAIYGQSLLPMQPLKCMVRIPAIEFSRNNVDLNKSRIIIDLEQENQHRTKQFLADLPHKKIPHAASEWHLLPDRAQNILLTQSTDNQRLFLHLINLPRELTKEILNYTFDCEESKRIFCSMPLAQGLIKYAYDKEKYNKDSKLKKHISLHQLYATPTSSIIALYDAIAHFEKNPHQPHVINYQQKQALIALPNEIKINDYFSGKPFKIQKSWLDHGKKTTNYLTNGFSAILAKHTILIPARLIHYYGSPKLIPLLMPTNIIGCTIFARQLILETTSKSHVFRLLFATTPGYIYYLTAGCFAAILDTYKYHAFEELHTVSLMPRFEEVLRLSALAAAYDQLVIVTENKFCPYPNLSDLK
jgi:hypothetical protein